MKLEDLKVIDIIQTPQFEKHIEALIKDLYLTRTKIMNERPDVQFKRGPIERLQEKKVFGPKALAALYAKVVDKTINTSEYPSTLRTFIKGIGDKAFHKTYVELKQAEDEQSNKRSYKPAGKYAAHKCTICRNKTTIIYIRKMKKVLKFLWRRVGILYFPIYLLAWVLHKIARLTLAIAYFGLLNKQAGKDIIKSLFKWHGRY